jgi:hypothetical protein
MYCTQQQTLSFNCPLVIKRGDGAEINEDIEDLINAWKRRDVRARGYILATTELSQQRLLISCTTAHQMWRTLSAQHLEHAADNRLDVQARFYSYQYQPGTDMKNHIAEISSLAHHLGEIGLPVNEEQLCTKIISILPAEYHGQPGTTPTRRDKHSSP